MSDIVQFTVSEGENDLRLDQVVSARLEQQCSRSGVQRLIKEGLVSVGGVVAAKTSVRVRTGQNVEVRSRIQQRQVEPRSGELEILFQDETVIAVNKPAGLSVHPAPHMKEETLVHRLLHHFPELEGADAYRPGIVHRLDKDTTGVVLVARSEAARRALAAQFAARSVEKTYLAVVPGRPDPPSAEIDLPIGRHPTLKTRMAVVKGGRNAVSRYETVWSSPDGGFSLLRVEIDTGRTHQIRVHLSRIGNPVAGDAVYGGKVRPVQDVPSTGRVAGLVRRPLLHAHRICFTHPGSGERITIFSRMPRDMRRAVLLAGRRVQKVCLTGLPGCGKSRVLEEFGRLGAPVWSADDIVRGLYAVGGEGHDYLRRRFGDRFLDEEGRTERKRLFGAMIENPGLRREMEALLHPLVRHELEHFFRDSGLERFCVAEIPLLVETGWHRKGFFDVVVAVESRDDLRHERLLARGWTGPEIVAVDGWHAPEKTKRAAADFVIRNNGSPEELQAEVRRVQTELRRKRSADVRERALFLDIFSAHGQTD